MKKRKCTCQSVNQCKHRGKFIACSMSDGSRCVEFSEINEDENKKINLKFGQFITVTGKLKRARRMKTREDKYNIYLGPSNRYAYWKIEKFNTSGKGIFLGYRTLYNGYCLFDYEDGSQFVQQEHFKAALVCLSERENPIYVALDQIIK